MVLALVKYALIIAVNAGLLLVCPLRLSCILGVAVIVCLSAAWAWHGAVRAGESQGYVKGLRWAQTRLRQLDDPGASGFQQ